MQKRDFKGVWIPKEIWEINELSVIERLVLSVIKSDIKFATNNEFSKFMQLSPNRLSEIKSKLTKLGYIEEKKLTAEQIKEIVLKEKNTGFECEWCKTKTKAIQEHHYPIRRCDGGKDVVLICPNCHYEFHKLENMKKDGKR